MNVRLQRKWVLIELRQCVYCKLLFRYPTDATIERTLFYEDAYESKRATTLPSILGLRTLMDTGFRDSRYDKGARVAYLKEWRENGRALDFGAAWGYAAYQLRGAGYDAAGFEISRSRAAFARRHLGLEMYSNWNEILKKNAGGFDLIYTDHTLEHMPNLRIAIENLSSLLKPGGYLVAFVPNGGGLKARTRGTDWGPLIGEVHTVAITAEWCARNLPTQNMRLLKFESLPSTEGNPIALDGEELAIVAQRT